MRLGLTISSLVQKMVADLPDLRKKGGERGNMARKPLIRIALVENDPLRVVGFRTLFESVSGFELVPVSLSDIRGLPSIDLVLLSDRNVQNLFELMIDLKATHPYRRIIVTGSGDEGTILQALVAGA